MPTSKADVAAANDAFVYVKSLASYDDSVPGWTWATGTIDLESIGGGIHSGDVDSETDYVAYRRIGENKAATDERLSFLYSRPQPGPVDLSDQAIEAVNEPVLAAISARDKLIAY